MITWLYRGYTGHEMLDSFQLIHMNGRLYDPVIARMLSPDPFVQAPNSLQNYNRYSYVMNNPLSFTDPSGYRYLPKLEIKFAAGFDDNNYSSIGGKFFPNPGFSSDVWSMIDAAWNNAPEDEISVFYGSDYSFETGNYSAYYFSSGGIKVDKEGYAYVIYQKGYSSYFEVNGHGYMPTLIKAGKAYVNLPEIRSFGDVLSKANDLYKNTETLVDDVFFLANDIVKTVMSNNTLSIANKYGLKTVDVRLPITGAIEMNKNKFLSFTSKLKNIGTVSTTLAYGGILYDIYDNKQITVGNVYQGIVTTAALWPGYGWMVAAGALALDAISYSYNGKSFASNLNESLNGGVLYKHKSNKE